MAIRLRTVNDQRVALCAAETDEKPGDTYLDDADHHALGLKFERDWHSEGVLPRRITAEPENDEAAESQRLRDGATMAEQWSRDVAVESEAITREKDGDLVALERGRIELRECGEALETDTGKFGRQYALYPPYHAEPLRLSAADLKDVAALADAMIAEREKAK